MGNVACDWCGRVFSVAPSHYQRGQRCCSRSCGARSRRRNFENLYPELVEVITLMYPFMSTKDLADFLGMPWRWLQKYAVKRRLLKDPQWLRAQGRPTHWPAEPELREVYRLRVALTRAINLALNQRGMEPTT